jgi:hypothetical protein
VMQVLADPGSVPQGRAIVGKNAHEVVMIASAVSRRSIRERTRKTI